MNSFGPLYYQSFFDGYSNAFSNGVDYIIDDLDANIVMLNDLLKDPLDLFEEKDDGKLYPKKEEIRRLLKLTKNVVLPFLPVPYKESVCDVNSVLENYDILLSALDNKVLHGKHTTLNVTGSDMESLCINAIFLCVHDINTVAHRIGNRPSKDGQSLGRMNFANFWENFDVQQGNTSNQNYPALSSFVSRQRSIDEERLLFSAKTQLTNALISWQESNLSYDSSLPFTPSSNRLLYDFSVPEKKEKQDCFVELQYELDNHGNIALTRSGKPKITLVCVSDIFDAFSIHIAGNPIFDEYIQQPMLSVQKDAQQQKILSDLQLSHANKSTFSLQPISFSQQSTLDVGYSNSADRSQTNRANYTRLGRTIPTSGTISSSETKALNEMFFQENTSDSSKKANHK